MILPIGRFEPLQILGNEHPPEDPDIVHRTIRVLAVTFQECRGEAGERHGPIPFGPPSRHIGPLMPPSFRTRQKWIMISRATPSGIATQCRT